MSSGAAVKLYQGERRKPKPSGRISMTPSPKTGSLQDLVPEDAEDQVCFFSPPKSSRPSATAARCTSAIASFWRSPKFSGGRPESAS